jgi:GAF domain-containing protein
LCVVPLLLHGRTIGALRLSFDTPHVFDSDERGFITAVAGQAALALRAARKRGS